MIQKIKLMTALFLVSVPAAFSQRSAKEVLEKNGQPQYNHQFTTEISVLKEKNAKPVLLNVGIEIDSTFIRIKDSKDFKLEIPVNGVTISEDFSNPGLLFSVDLNDDFYLFWDEPSQKYTFWHSKSYKKFTRVSKYYPLIKQVDFENLIGKKNI